MLVFLLNSYGIEEILLYTHAWVWVFPLPSVYYSRFVPTMVDVKISFYVLFLSESQNTVDGDENTHTHAWAYKIHLFLAISKNHIFLFLRSKRHHRNFLIGIIYSKILTLFFCSKEGPSLLAQG
jgi:hypothetical protein